MGSLNASLTQLEEYFPYMEEVIGSSPIRCTNASAPELESRDGL